MFVKENENSWGFMNTIEGFYKSTGSFINEEIELNAKGYKQDMKGASISGF